MKKYFKDMDLRRNYPVVLGAIVLSGIVGFIYETIFYYFNNGAYTRRGDMFGPWILIYAVGSVFLMLTTYRLHKNKHPLLVFVVSGLVASALEFATGYAMYHSSGVRTWDYNTEILNWGNIGGFVCFRSFWSFGLMGIILMYLIVPFLKRLRKRWGDKRFLVAMLILFGIFAVDLLYNSVLYKVFGTINALQFYTNTGWYDIVTQYK